MEHSERIKHKMEEKTIFLLCDLQKVFGKLDPDTFESVQHMIYATLQSTADDVVSEKWMEGK
jgi:hypothetical protein